MLLVPRQLRRAGMTGNVPYYGGRFTPAQAYAAAHPPHPPPGPPHPPPPPAYPPPPPAYPVRPADQPPGPPARTETDPLPALQHLLDTGVINAEEYQQLRARVTR
jgi:hypothetical protein